jgi:hypothetical protein
MRSFTMCILHQILLGLSNQGESGGLRMGEIKNVYKVLVGKSERKKLHGRLGVRG